MIEYFRAGNESRNQSEEYLERSIGANKMLFTLECDVERRKADIDAYPAGQFEAGTVLVRGEDTGGGHVPVRGELTYHNAREDRHTAHQQN